MQVLSEHLTFDEAKVVVESSNEGKDLYMKGICIQGNVKNANQRVYPTFEINKAVSKTISYTGLGSIDTVFGFFFGFFRAYIISICIFSGAHIVYNYDKWPINLNKSYIFPYLEKGSNYLLKEFPNEKTYQDSKEKIEEL